MKRLRLLLALLLIAGASHLSATEAIARPSSPVMTGATIVTGSDTAWMRVRLPRPLKISTYPFDNPVVTILAGGEIAGIALKQDVPVGGLEVITIRTDLCSQTPCTGQPLTTTTVFDPEQKEFVEHETLPAGEYLLYVIADGAPTKARVLLPGLSGRTTLVPGTPARATFGDPSATVADPAGPFIYSAEANHGLGGAGISFVAFELDTENFAAMNISSCIEPLQEEPDPTDPVACEGGRTAGSALVTRHDLEGGRKIVTSMGLLGKNTWNHRISYKSAAIISGFKAREFSLTYDTGARGGLWLYSLSFSF